MAETRTLPIAGYEVLTLTFGPGIDVIAYGPDGVTTTIRLATSR